MAFTASELFPPRPRGLKGRSAELATLERLALREQALRVALVGSGGSGKSMLACALGHRVAKALPGGIHWLRSGPWDARTLAEMLALRFETSRVRDRVFAGLRARFAELGPLLIVLDNHENDRAVARVLAELEGSDVRWVITARRCLLGGVTIFPVVAPLVMLGRAAFPRVAALSGLLRHNPLALDIADAIVSAHEMTVRGLETWLRCRGAATVRVIDHEDDLPEVALLVEWAWERLSDVERRLMAVLAYVGGDHVDAASLFELAASETPFEAAGYQPAPFAHEAMSRLLGWHLVQQPLAGRFALHAVVRYAISKRARFAAHAIHAHYLDLLESTPARLDLEQTHLYAAMDFAHAHSKLDWMLRIDALVARLSG